MLRCFIFINQRKCTFTYVLIYLLAILLACFLLCLVTYLLVINSIYMEILLFFTENFSKTTLRKLLTFWRGILIIIFVDKWKGGVKNWTTLSGRSRNWINWIDFILKTYAVFKFLTQINVIRKKIYIYIFI